MNKRKISNCCILEQLGYTADDEFNLYDKDNNSLSLEYIEKDNLRIALYKSRSNQLIAVGPDNYLTIDTGNNLIIGVDSDCSDIDIMSSESDIMEVHLDPANIDVSKRNIMIAIPCHDEFARENGYSKTCHVLNNDGYTMYFVGPNEDKKQVLNVYRDLCDPDNIIYSILSDLSESIKLSDITNKTRTFITLSKAIGPLIKKYLIPDDRKTDRLEMKKTFNS